MTDSSADLSFWDVVEARRSVRQFDAGRDVPQQMVKQILRAALRAPSAGNRQPWHFIVVRDPQVKDELSVAAYGQLFVAQAPVVFAVCADPERSASRYHDRGRRLYCLQDTAAAIEHILLAATALGLGSCWVGAFDEELAAEVLRLPPSLRPVALIPVGYPQHEQSVRTSRRPLGEVMDVIA
jgi:nitroreductase